MKGFSWLSIIIAVATVVIVAGGGYFAYQRLAQKEALRELRSFEDCVKAGYPVAESYPRQCHAPDGKRFVEEITQPAQTQIQTR